tara:strand:- start:6470 stop:6673 length:204 start_codon:yes stop_codon:yes gene_type:complete
MKVRKMLSITAETHDALFKFLADQKKTQGLKITASSFAEHAIKTAIERQNSSNRTWAIDNNSTRVSG